MSGRPPDGHGTEAGSGRAPGSLASAALAAGVAAVAGALGWCYGEEFRGLVRAWSRDPDYSHGFLVVPLAALIFWRRLRRARVGRLEPSAWGWVGLAAVLAARAGLHERGNLGGEVITILPAVACLTLALGGWRLLGAAWPAVAYLAFMVPLPPRVDAAVALPLQRLATAASCSLLKATGLWVIAEGNVIHVGADRLEVAEACSGLSMMVTLAATVAAVVLVASLRPWKRAVLLGSIVPVAVGSNVLRIAATAWCYRRFGAAAGGRFAHDAAGWLMMPAALALVGLEMAALGWAFVEEEAVDEPTLLGRPIARDRPGRRVEPGPGPGPSPDLGPGFGPGG